jgi:hypothetical protein
VRLTVLFFLTSIDNLIEAKKSQTLLEAERVKTQKLEARAQAAEAQVAEIPELRVKADAFEAGKLVFVLDEHHYEPLLNRKE